MKTDTQNNHYFLFPLIHAMICKMLFKNTTRCIFQRLSHLCTSELKITMEHISQLTLPFKRVLLGETLTTVHACWRYAGEGFSFKFLNLND